ncbi:MAG: hypothetical protein ACK55I_29000, partial [bacterium]
MNSDALSVTDANTTTPLGLPYHCIGNIEIEACPINHHLVKEGCVEELSLQRCNCLSFYSEAAALQQHIQHYCTSSETASISKNEITAMTKLWCDRLFTCSS